MWDSSTTTRTEAVLLHKLWWRKTFLKKNKPVQDFNPSHRPYCNATAFQTLRDFVAFPQKATSGLESREKGRALPSASLTVTPWAQLESDFRELAPARQVLSGKESGAHLCSQFIHKCPFCTPERARTRTLGHAVLPWVKTVTSEPCTNTCKENGIYSQNDNPPWPA